MAAIQNIDLDELMAEASRGNIEVIHKVYNGGPGFCFKVWLLDRRRIGLARDIDLACADKDFILDMENAKLEAKPGPLLTEAQATKGKAVVVYYCDRLAWYRGIIVAAHYAPGASAPTFTVAFEGNTTDDTVPLSDLHHEIESDEPEAPPPPAPVPMPTPLPATGPAPAPTPPVPVPGPTTILQKLETFYFGTPQQGGLIPRIVALETQEFGAPQQGNAPARIQALREYFETQLGA